MSDEDAIVVYPHKYPDKHTDDHDDHDDDHGQNSYDCC